MVAESGISDYPSSMARAVRQLVAEALQLPEEERLALATELIDSVEGLPDPDWEAAWLKAMPIS